MSSVTVQKPSSSDVSDNAIDGVHNTILSSTATSRPPSGNRVPVAGCASVHITRHNRERAGLGGDAASAASGASAQKPLLRHDLDPQGMFPPVHLDSTSRATSPEAWSGSPDLAGRGDSACLKRIRTWYHRLLHLRANPSSLEYSYLVLSNPSAVHYHPYDLTVVPHNQINPQFYYTMSVDGVTHVNGTESTHMTLDEFERGCGSFVCPIHRSNSRGCACSDHFPFGTTDNHHFLCVFRHFLCGACNCVKCD